MMAVAAAAVHRRARRRRAGVGVSYRARRSSAERHRCVEHARSPCRGRRTSGCRPRAGCAAPSATSRPPIHEASTGLPAMWAYGTSSLGRAVGSVIACGVRMTSRPSAAGSAAAISSALAYRSGGASPMMSIGLLWLQTAGSTSLRRSIVAGERSVSWPPPPIRASVASTPGPPALVTMVRRGPCGRGCLASTSAMPNRSEMRSTRSTPTRRKAASRTSSEPVSEPVCEAAALAACAGPAGLDDDDRLGQGDLARRRQEGPRVADRLHVDDDAVGVRVVAQVVDDVAPADVEHRAERHDRAEADALGRAPVQDGGQQRARSG